MGLVTKETDALGRETYYGYNNNGWKIWTVNPDGSTTDLYYALEGANGGENTITTVYNESYAVTDYFDGLGRIITQTERPVNGTETVLSEYFYDKHRVSEVYDAKGNYSKYGYDALDRVTSLSQRDSEDTILGQ
jgi:YD repeat-containing protein